MNMPKSRELHAKIPSPKAIFIPASNEPSSHACMDIWRLPRGSNTPLLAALQIRYPVACSGVFDWIFARNCEGTEQLRTIVLSLRLL